MKADFLKLILDFIKKYPQVQNGKIRYTFAGSISLNLLSCISGSIISMYSFDNFKKINELKVDRIFKDFFRQISDIDIELYEKETFELVDFDKKIHTSSLEFRKYTNCFNRNINKIYLDFFNSKSNYIFELKFNNTSIWIDDFRLNYGYRLKTLTNLSDKRFNINHPKYNYTFYKYSHDIDYLYNIFMKCFGKKRTTEFIKESWGSFSCDNASVPEELQINKLLNRLDMLDISENAKLFLFNVIEQFKLQTYNNHFFKEKVFLLNNFYNVQEISLIQLGKSKNIKYKIRINNEYYLLKINEFMTEKETNNIVKVIKRINKYLPENSQHLEFYGYSKKLKKSFIVYKYISGNNLNDIKSEDLYSLGVITGKILLKFHHIPTIGLSLKNESKFLRRIQKQAILDKSNNYDIQNITRFIKNNSVNLGKKCVLLHNDLNLGNIIYSNGKIIIIDFDNCVKGDWFIDFKKKIRNKNDFFKGVFDGYSKSENLFNKKVNLVLFLYEYYYMKNIPIEMSKRKEDILQHHKEFLDYFSNTL